MPKGVITHKTTYLPKIKCNLIWWNIEQTCKSNPHASAQITQIAKKKVINSVAKWACQIKAVKKEKKTRKQAKKKEKEKKKNCADNY